MMFSMEELDFACKDAIKTGFNEAIDKVEQHLIEMSGKSEGKYQEAVEDILDWLPLLVWEHETG